MKKNSMKANKKKLAFIGAGAQADASLLLIDDSRYEFVGFFDDKPIMEHAGYPILGKIEDVSDRIEKGLVDSIFITIGDNSKRAEVFRDLQTEFYNNFINIIASTAVILDYASIQGVGIFVGHNSFVGQKTVVGDNTIVNTGVIIEHHSSIGFHCNLAPNATVNGSVILGDGVYVGSGAVIIQVLNIASWTIIGAGAVVIGNIEKPGTYVGVPAKEILSNE